MRQPRAAFTLAEVLVALALTAALLLLLSNLLVGTGRAVSLADARNEAVAEGSLAQALVASKVRQAWYVVPPGTVLNLGSGFSTRNPAGGNSFAMGLNAAAVVLPPQAAGGQYQLLVYYPLRRTVMVEQASGANRLDPDPGNDGAWLLMELRHNMGVARPFDPAVLPGQPGGMRTDTSYGGVPGRMVLDYLRPPLPGEAPLLTPLAGGAGSVGVTVNLQSERRLRGHTVRYPPQPEPLAVYARNVNR